MLIAIVLWSHKPNKQPQSNNHTYRAITQHINSIILTTKSEYKESKCTDLYND